ncbi:MULTISPECIES: hypothetical protein [unclassified Nocardia]|uniref:hypothetical protein n=1 Tax=unclassified Nocardia TaxID=2637762 RepID=UPI001CE40E81|nr:MULTISPECIES: hypothetical protein [unclassified Nocardia]
MTVQRFMASGLLCAASLLAVAPLANAETGSSSISSQINVGCLLQSLSGGSRTADCGGAHIPVNDTDPNFPELAVH